jgi:hypothetical protein
MSVPQVVTSAGPRGTRFKQAAARRVRRATLLAVAVGIAAVVVTACSGPTDGSSSNGEGSVGAGSAGANGGGRSAAASEPPAYKTIGPVGSEPGKLIIKPASGSTGISPTWSTVDACPDGYQTSAVLYATVYRSAILMQQISGTVNPGASPVPVGEPLEIGATVAQVQGVTNTPNGQTDKWVVQCSAGLGGLGNHEDVQYIYVHYSKDGKSYTTSSG